MKIIIITNNNNVLNYNSSLDTKNNVNVFTFKDKDIKHCLIRNPILSQFDNSIFNRIICTKHIFSCLDDIKDNIKNL